MSLSKIPDSLLKKFQCVVCDRYLSMAPIGVREDGESICNRCTDWMAPQSAAVARCKVFEELARLHLFPCSYRSQGCMEYIQFNRAFEHENKCAYHTYSCPVNIYSTCNWIGTVYQISGHYKEQHPELFLKIPKFRIDMKDDYEVYYLVEVDGILLLLQIRVEGRKCWFNAVYIGSDADDSSLIKFRVRLNGEDSARAMELEAKSPLPITHMEMIPNESAEVGTDSLLALLCYPQFIQCQWFITTSYELQNRTPFQKQTGNEVENDKIKCSNCKFSMVPPIYRCPLGHVICVDCKGYNENCDICHENHVEFSRAIDLENIAQAAKFSCRWRNCQQVFSYEEIRTHEQQCAKRIYRCPECNKFVGVFYKMYRHFKNVHKDIPFDISKTDSVNFSVKAHVVYVLVHNEIFQVNVTKDSGNAWTVYITYCGPPGLESLWKYEVRDRYNVLHYASKCSKNRYKASQRSVYYTNSVRSEYYLTVRFNKQKSSDIWIPLDCPKRIRK